MSEIFFKILNIIISAVLYTIEFIAVTVTALLGLGVVGVIIYFIWGIFALN